MTIRVAEKEERILRIDADRVNKVNSGKMRAVGVTVGGVHPPEGTGSCTPYPQPIDIVFLDTASINRYLRSKGGRNDLAEDIVRHMLGHPVGARDE